MGVVRTRLVLPASAVALSAGLALVTAPPPAQARVPACSAGLVALTFDDGPATTLTPKLVRMLTDRRVPATFFVVGDRVDSAPAAARRIARAGFTIANHSYHHEQLTRLTEAGIRRTLNRTRRSAVRAGVPMSRLVRPPYGAIDGRVRGVVDSMGLVPVLWTVDPRDWASGRSTAAITSSVLAQLRPHRTNIVLQHDGVANSPRSVAAVPRIIRAARARGYCFARLGRTGRPVPPVPRVSVADAHVTESTGRRVSMRVTVRLDRPTSRATSVVVSTANGSARVGTDYDARRVRVGFPVGVTHAVVRVPVRGDNRDEATERFRVRLSGARGLRLADASGSATILDDDAAPTVALRGTTATEPGSGSTPATVRVVLSRPSGRTVSVRVRTVPGTADSADFTPVDTTVTLRPGARAGTVVVPVLADALDEPEERFTVRVVSAGHAAVGAGTATVSILPPTTAP